MRRRSSSRQRGESQLSTGFHEDHCSTIYPPSNSSQSSVVLMSPDSSMQASHLTGSSSTIMGDFFPIRQTKINRVPSPKKSLVDVLSMMADTSSVVENGLAFDYSASRLNVLRSTHPYEFEPETAYAYGSNCQSKASDFVKKHGSSPAVLSTPRLPNHVKNSHSVGTATSTVPEMSTRKPLFRNRSESSPSVPPLRLFQHREPSPARTIQPGYEAAGGIGDKSWALDKSIQRDRQCIQNEALVKEGSAQQISITATTYPPKRSRSPMKKMFGEHGWLGKSPDELDEVKARLKKELRNAESAETSPKRSGMIGKLKNKLEEFADKADLSSKYTRSDKFLKLPALSISVGPVEQARISMELELSLVLTANNFLMNEFRQSRMDLESMKAVVDAWDNKGRPRVIEFMYDQAAQRELVLANVHNFRFHGERAGDDIRINAILYNWKKVSSQMAIRTFCDSDSVILKLMFDIEQILELLGATEPVLFRLQQLRAYASQLIRNNGQKENQRSRVPNYDDYRGGLVAKMSRGASAADLTDQSSEGSERRGGDSHSSACPRVGERALIDPYGGMRLVPDQYEDEDELS